MKQGKIKKLGYGVSIHFNEYQKLFEIYRIGTYHPSNPNLNKDTQVVAKHKSLKKAVEKFKKITKK